MKTEAEIKTNIYKLLMSSPLKGEISGVITKRKRPLDSDKEDIVISILASKLGQSQPFTINVNIYVKDVDVNGQCEEDSERIEHLSKIAMTLFESKETRIGDSYKMELQEQHTMEVKGIDHHCINNKLLLTQINE